MSTKGRAAHPPPDLHERQRMNADVISTHSYIRVRDAAMEIGMSPDFVIDNLIHGEKVQAVRFGSRWGIDIESWRSYVAGLRGA